MTAVVGRDRERAKIASLFDAPGDGAGILLIEGEAGIGKTTLWRAGIDVAREAGYRILACAGAEAETQLSFTALRDLLEDVFDEVADELPAPQRDVLAVLLLRDDVGAHDGIVSRLDAFEAEVEKAAAADAEA